MDRNNYKDGYWYKQDISGYEGLAEETKWLASAR